mgnify:CR=1 FL=1
MKNKSLTKKIKDNMKKEKEQKPEVYIVQKLNIFTDEFLSELGGAPQGARKAIAHKVLLTFLGTYSSLVSQEAHDKSKELMLHFIPSINDIRQNDNLESAIQELVAHMSYAMKTVDDKESIIRPIIFKLICLYAALAVSDREGKVKCNALGKEISSNWSKSTPESVTLSYLKKKEKNSKLPISECGLLEKYSF